MNNYRYAAMFLLLLLAPMTNTDNIHIVNPLQLRGIALAYLVYDKLTINVPLFKKLRDIIFFCGTITF